MTPLGDNDFVWTFPTFLLARNFVTDHTTGDIYFNPDLQFIAPMVNPEGEQGVAMFTDRDLAEEYLALTSPELGMRLMEIFDAKALAYFLRNGAKKYRYLAVDPNRKTRTIRVIPVQAVLAAIDERDSPAAGRSGSAPRPG